MRRVRRRNRIELRAGVTVIKLTCPGGVYPDGIPYPNGELLINDEGRDDLEFEWTVLGEQSGCTWYVSAERREKRWSFWLGFARITP